MNGVEVSDPFGVTADPAMPFLKDALDPAQANAELRTCALAGHSMAGEICEALPEVREASVQLVAQIGRPVSAPLACFVEIIAWDAITDSLRGRVRDIARAVLEGSRPRG